MVIQLNIYVLNGKEEEMKIIKPGCFGKSVAADNRRMDFDFANEQALYLNKKIDFLFIGDSITWMWDYSLYFETNKCIIQRGAGGDTSTYLLKRFDADCIQLKPKTAIIMIGTNDISRCDEDLWWRTKGEDEDLVLKEYQENIKAMIKKCDDNNIEVVLCSVIPSTIAPPYDRERRWRMTDKMNAFLKAQGRRYINYFDSLTEDGKNIIYDLSHDGIHPNARAYEIMASVAKKELGI